MNNKGRSGEITGKISAAPNPISSGERCVVISQLGTADILFIDSSHTVKIGGDVNYLFLEILPRLKPGVIVRIHDIFLPFDYRRDWIMEQFRFWSEQYLQQTFLTFNSELEVPLANSCLNHCHQEELKVTFSTLSC